jgi:predicted dehydrogenase
VNGASLRIGLIGLGDIAVRAHLPAIERNPRTTLLECVAAISLTGLKLTLPAGGIDGLGKVVRRYAAEISAKLGAAPAAA